MNLKSCISMIKISLSVFFLFFLLSSFMARESTYCKMADRIVGNYVKEFVKSRGLSLTAYGGRMMNDIKEIEMRFLSFDKLNVDEARKLYVEMVEEFLIRLNQNDKIRPFLHDYPFGIKNIKLVIGFDDINRHILGDGHVAHMFIGRDDTLYYDAYNPKTEKFYTLHKENYREALKIIQNVEIDNSSLD